MKLHTWYSVIGVLVLLALLAGCAPVQPAPAVAPTQAAAPTQAPAAPTAAPQASSDKKITLGFANMVEGYEFATMTRQGIVDEAKARGWDVLLMNNNFDANTAMTNADAMVLKKVDAAVEFQLYEDVMPAMMEKFKAAGIPVLTIDIPAPGATFVGVDNYQAGRMGGEWLAKYAKEKWNGQPDLVLLLDDPTVGELPKKRVDGIYDAIVEGLPNLDKSKIMRQPGGGMREKGMDITRAVLTSHPDAHKILISGIDDISLLGGLAAVKELGRQKDVVMFGQGGEAEAIPEIRDPNSPYMGSVGYFFENYGKTIVPAAEKAIKGEKLPEFVYVPISLLTKETVNQYYPVPTPTP